ncbi:hypothetical protein L1887_07327 [Cichorium endivia]|nr:hypothetical protein L1887_07327 [Cichorium endivia]
MCSTALSPRRAFMESAARFGGYFVNYSMLYPNVLRPLQPSFPAALHNNNTTLVTPLLSSLFRSQPET